jgi:hypothetical protein
MTQGKPLRIVLLARQDTSPYYTYQRLVSIFTGFGFQASIVDSVQHVTEADIVITHNAYGFENKALNGLAEKGMRVVSFMDNPMDKVEFLRNIDPRIMIVFSDPAHIPLAKAIMQGKNRIIDHTLDISLEAAKVLRPIAERRYDVIFVGRLVTFGSVKDYSFLERRLAKRIVEATLHSADKLIHELAMDIFRPYKKLGLYKQEFISDHFLKYCWKLSHAVRREKRERALVELKKVDQKLKIAFVSNDTAFLKKQFSARHDFYDFMPWSEVIDLMGESKIVVNTMPSRVDCLHERLVEAMTNGAVCASDVNRKILAEFTDRKNILTFNYGSQPLSGALSAVIQDDAALQEIADAGRKRIGELVNDNNWLALVEKLVAE